MSMRFWDLDTSSIGATYFRDVTAALGSLCTERTIPIAAAQAWQPPGWNNAAMIGWITLRVTGTLTVHCDCTWTFTGYLTAAPDHFDFNRSVHRSTIGEASTTIGRQIPGEPFPFYFRGGRTLDSSGMMQGIPTCPKCEQ